MPQAALLFLLPTLWLPFVACVPLWELVKSVNVTDQMIVEAIYNDTIAVENGRNRAEPQKDDNGDEVCYDELGCFDRHKSIFSYIGSLPWSPEQIDTTFTLFTSANRENGIVFRYNNVSLAPNSLDSTGILLFIVHGFNAHATDEWLIALKDTALDTNRAVILVDWSSGCSFPFYAQSVVNMELVGREIAVVLWRLLQDFPGSVIPSLVHYVGHSLGAHIGRFFADYFAVLSGGLRFGRITALDPAGPLLENHHVYVNRSSANYVDILHTSAGDDTFAILTGKLGMYQAVGHLDLYVNGGSTQPGCAFWEFMCAHSRAHEYYVSAARLANPKKGGLRNCSLKSYACMGGMEEYFADNCHRIPGQWNAISLDCSYSMPGRGTEFVDTTGKVPYCKPS